MRITERRLKRIIRSIIRESIEQLSFNVGDKVRVIHLDPPYSGDRMDWGGCTGIISSIDFNTCQVVVKDPTGELHLLKDMPMDPEYLQKI